MGPTGVERTDVTIDAAVAPLISSRLDRHECAVRRQDAALDPALEVAAVIEIPLAYGGPACW